MTINPVYPQKGIKRCMHQSNARMSLKRSITQRLRTDFLTTATEIVWLSGSSSKSPHFSRNVQLIRHTFTNLLILKYYSLLHTKCSFNTPNKIALNIGYNNILMFAYLDWCQYYSKFSIISSREYKVYTNNTCKVWDGFMKTVQPTCSRCSVFR